ncbi:MAG: F0F1 ATP synthase subunit A [Hyphomicrobiaceae bacterium]
MHQFEIHEIIPLEVFGLKASFTNSSAFMLLAVALISAFLILSMRGRSLVPTRLQSMAELSYEYIAGLVRTNLGQEGMRFFPFVFSLFMFIFFANMLGMIPGFFTVTSHIIITFALAMLVMTIVVGYGIYKNGFGFLKLFVPSGVPWVIMPLLMLIEFVSFLSRPLSLSIRLFANMLAGHITMKVFAGFVVSLGALGAAGLPLAFVPFTMTVALTVLEVFVAFLQAFVFTVLTCIYLNDALHPGHH